MKWSKDSKGILIVGFNNKIEKCNEEKEAAVKRFVDAIEVLEKEKNERLERLKNEIIYLQTRLTCHGYKTVPDGMYGERTRYHVELFQRDHGFEVTGCIEEGDKCHLALINDIALMSKEEFKDGQLSEHFNIKEFACKANGELPPDGVPPLLIERLEKVRARWDKPMVITSGYRTPEYNARVGGAEHSQHLRAYAADIYIPGVPQEELYKAMCDEFSDGGVGRYTSFTHGDVRGWYVRW